MLAVNEQIQIPDGEFSWSFVRSSGPGGQNVNKVASKAVLRWSVETTSTLPPEVKLRLRTQQRRRITLGGELIVASQRYRDQERNREDCLEKLAAMVLRATAVPKIRKKKLPSRASKERRLVAKKHRSRTKSDRKVRHHD